MQSDADTVDEYIELLDEERKSAIIRIRNLVKTSLPEIEETMKYKMPTYLQRGFEIAIASQKHYISVYVHREELINKYKGKFSKVNAGKSCLRFKSLKEEDYQILAELFKEIDQLV